MRPVTSAAPKSRKSRLTMASSSATLAKPLSNLRRFLQVRLLSEQLCAPLATEDYVVQSMPDVSPAKWHIAHTTWFFETFLLAPYLPSYKVFHPKFGYLFNSYYEAIGARHPRAQRGLLTRPTVAEVYQYRAYVDEAMTALLAERAGEKPGLQDLLILGLHHEQQHQELLMTDLKHILSTNPLRPAYRSDLREIAVAQPASRQWVSYAGGLHAIGHEGEEFAFDNEGPRHQVYLQDFQLASQPVTNGEYLEFMNAGGYQNAEYWLAEGWMTLQTEGWNAPLYWEQIDGQWFVMTLGGLRALNEREPVCHVSLFEADAFARWAGKRLPSEAEWEVAAAQEPIQGNFLSQDFLHPMPSNTSQLYGDVWEWTQSAYLPYPNFKTAAGAVGEYNGKFMCNQMVLRGGSCVTPPDHIRLTYRNFFPTSARWQFTGFRLAKFI